MPLDINAFRSIAAQSPDKFGKDGKVDLEAEHKRLTVELMNLPDGPEFNLKNARKDELERQMREVEIQQTENLSDQRIVDLVENAIRSRPQDFPLLTKYYLNAQ